MKHPLRYVLVLALTTGSVTLGACSDDSSTGEEDSGGSAGAAGSKTGGSSAGGSANSGGDGGSDTAGTSAIAGAGGATDGGMGGAAHAGAGGSAPDAGGSDAGGAGGAGSSGAPGLVYTCGSANLWQKTCSAWVAADCADTTVCSDCVVALTADREGFTDPACATCDDKYEAFYQCQVDAFESDNLAFGVECVEGWGADGTANCYPLLEEAIQCQGYVGSDQDPKPCPATWPPQ